MRRWVGVALVVVIVVACSGDSTPSTSGSTMPPSGASELSSTAPADPPPTGTGSGWPEVLVTNDAGVFHVDSRGVITQLLKGPVAHAVDDTLGGLVYQLEMGRGALGVDDVGPATEASTVVWWLPAGSSTSQELLVPEPGKGHALSLADTFPTDESFGVVYLRHEGSIPFDSDFGAADMADTLRVFDVASSTVTPLFEVRGWEWNLTAISAGGGLVTATEVQLYGSGCRLFDTLGQSIARRGIPTARSTCFEEGERCPILCAISADGSQVAYVDDPQAAESDSTIVVRDVVTGDERWRHALDGGPGRVPVCLDVEGDTVLVNWSDLDGTPSSAWLVDITSSSTIEIPVAGKATLVAAPISSHASSARSGVDPGTGEWNWWSKTNHVQPRGVHLAPDGSVWAMTGGGLVRWDRGGDYEVISDPAWPDPAPGSMVISPEGEVWVGFHIHVARLYAGRWILYEFPANDPSWGTIELAIGPSGAVWAASNQLGVQRFDGADWKAVSDDLPGRGDLDAFTIDGRGRPWMGSYWSGLWVLEPGGWSHVQAGSVRLLRAGAGDDVWYVIDSGHVQDTVVAHRDARGSTTVYPLGWNNGWEIVPFAEGAYVGTNVRLPDTPEADGLDGHGLWYLGDGLIEAIPGPWDELGRQVLGVAVETDGTVWLGGQTGLWRHNATFSERLLTDTTAGFHVDFLVAGADSLIWAGGCEASSIWVDGRWEALPSPPNPSGDCDAAVGHDGTLWLADRDGIAHFDGDTWVLDRVDGTGTRWNDIYPPCDSEACDDRVWVLGAAAEVWAGMVGVEDGLWRYDGDEWQPFTGAFAQGSGGLVDLEIDEAGTLWVATDGGVHRRNGDGAWTYERASTIGGPPDGIRKILAGGGVLWVAGQDEVARFDGSEWSSFDLGSWPNLLAVDADGAVWIQTSDGVDRFDGTERYPVRLPAPGGSVGSMVFTDDGSRWMQSGSDVFRWVP